MSNVIWMTSVWLCFILAVLVLCIARPNAGRLFVGVFFLVMALGVNMPLVFGFSQGFVVLGQDSFFAWYRLFFTQVVALAPALFGLLAVAYELTLGLLLLGKRGAVKAGLIMGIVFLVGTAPLMLWSLPNLGMAAALAVLLTKTYDTTLLDMLQARRRTHAAHVRSS